MSSARIRTRSPGSNAGSRASARRIWAEVAWRSSPSMAVSPSRRRWPRCDPPRAGRWPRARAPAILKHRRLDQLRAHARHREAEQKGQNAEQAWHAAKTATAAQRHHSQNRRTPATSRPAAPSQTGGRSEREVHGNAGAEPTGSQRSARAPRAGCGRARPGGPAPWSSRGRCRPARPRLAAWSGRCAIAVFVLDHAPTSRLHNTSLSTMSIITRFAPSPTGFLHIGARTALFNWLYARHHGGKYLLRIEDTDRARSTAAAIQAIFDGLSWLGVSGDEPPVFQSQRQQRHAEVARQLLAQGAAYRCYCTPEELAAKARARTRRGPDHRLRWPLPRSQPGRRASWGAPGDPAQAPRQADGDRGSGSGCGALRQRAARRHGAAALRRHPDLHALGRGRRSRHGDQPHHPRRRSSRERRTPGPALSRSTGRCRPSRIR